MKFFSENKAWKEFQKMIVEYKKAFVPSLELLQLGSIKRLFKQILFSDYVYQWLKYTDG